MKLLVITEVSGIIANDPLSQAVNAMSVQDMEIEYYNPRDPGTVPADLKPMTCSIIMNNIRDAIFRSDYIILDGRMSGDLYKISLGMLYTQNLDRVFVFGSETDYNALRNALLNRKSNTPFTNTAIRVTESPTAESEGYDDLFYRLWGSAVARITFDESVYQRFYDDYVLLGLLWALGELEIYAGTTIDPYFIALMERC